MALVYGTIRIIDLVFIKKDEDGEWEAVELSNLPASEAAPWEDVDGEYGSLLNDEDIAFAADLFERNSSAGLLVFENVWATRLRDAIVGAGGRLVDNARIPAAVVDNAVEAMHGSE